MIFEMPNCGGCRTCEMACSYHHAGMFQPSISSIQIADKQSIGGYEVFLAENLGLQCQGPVDRAPIRSELEDLLLGLAHLLAVRAA